MQQGSDRHDQDLGRRSIAELPQQLRTAAHRFNGWAYSFERERLPCGEDLCMFGAEPGFEIAGQPFGCVGGGSDDHNRPAITESSNCSEHHRLCSLGDRQVGVFLSK